MSFPVKDTVVNRGLLILAKFRHSHSYQVDGVIALELCLIIVVCTSQKVSELKIGEIWIAKSTKPSVSPKNLLLTPQTRQAIRPSDSCTRGYSR